jgi:hypothetical protein
VGESGAGPLPLKMPSSPGVCCREASVPVLELAFARENDVEEFRFPTDLAEIEAMSWKQMTILATSLTTPKVDEENGVVAVMEANGTPK